MESVPTEDSWLNSFDGFEDGWHNGLDDFGETVVAEHVEHVEDNKSEPDTDESDDELDTTNSFYDELSNDDDEEVVITDRRYFSVASQNLHRHVSGTFKPATNGADAQPGAFRSRSTALAFQNLTGYYTFILAQRTA